MLIAVKIKRQLCAYREKLNCDYQTVVLCSDDNRFLGGMPNHNNIEFSSMFCDEL